MCTIQVCRLWNYILSLGQCLTCILIWPLQHHPSLLFSVKSKRELRLPPSWDMFHSVSSQGNTCTWPTSAVLLDFSITWFEEDIKHSSQWAKLRIVRTVVTHALLHNHRQLGCVRVVTMWMPQCIGKVRQSWDSPLWGADLWRDIWDVCTQPTAAIKVRHTSAYSPTTLPGNHKADTLTKAGAVLLEDLKTSLDMAHGVTENWQTPRPQNHLGDGQGVTPLHQIHWRAGIWQGLPHCSLWWHPLRHIPGHIRLATSPVTRW